MLAVAGVIVFFIALLDYAACVTAGRSERNSSFFGQDRER